MHFFDQKMSRTLLFIERNFKKTAFRLRHPQQKIAGPTRPRYLSRKTFAGPTQVEGRHSYKPKKNPGPAPSPGQTRVLRWCSHSCLCGVQWASPASVRAREGPNSAFRGPETPRESPDRAPREPQERPDGAGQSAPGHKTAPTWPQDAPRLCQPGPRRSQTA